MTIKIELPKLHKAQAIVYRDPARFRVLSCGRRWGKTRLGMNLLAERALAGEYAAYFCPTYKLLDETWRGLLQLLRPAASRIDSQQKRIELMTGGLLDFWSTDGRAPARGRKYHLGVLDECAFEPKLMDVWQKAIRPTLTDYKGKALFISTPQGHDGFHTLFNRGKSDTAYPDWAAYQMPSSSNPFLPSEEIDVARAELPELIFRQEYLAEFVTRDGTLMRPHWLQHTEAPLEGLNIRMGVDLALSQRDGADYSAAVILGFDGRGNIYVMHAERIRASFHQVLQWIKYLAQKFAPSVINIEQVQYQAAVVQELQRTTTLPVRGVRPDKDKIARFLPLQTRYEQGLVWHAPTLPPEFERELLAFPLGEHDDFVDAASYALMEPKAQQYVMTRPKSRAV